MSTGQQAGWRGMAIYFGLESKEEKHRATLIYQILLLLAFLALAVTNAWGQTAVRINAGGPLFSPSGGPEWAADQYFTGGGTFQRLGANIAGTSMPKIYESERYGSFNYKIPAPNGSYQLSLHFAEIYFSQTGQRVFNVSAQGAPLLQNFDILKEVPPYTALIKTFFHLRC